MIVPGRGKAAPALGFRHRRPIVPVGTLVSAGLLRGYAPAVIPVTALRARVCSSRPEPFACATNVRAKSATAGRAAFCHANGDRHIEVAAGEQSRARQVALHRRQHRRDMAEGVGLAGLQHVDRLPRLFRRHRDQRGRREDLGQVRFLRALGRHGDAHAGTVDLRDAGDRRCLRNQIRGLDLEHDRTEFDRLGAVGGDADEGRVERAVAERRDDARGVLELHKVELHAGALRQLRGEVGNDAAQAAGLHAREIRHHPHRDAQRSGRGELRSNRHDQLA